MAKAEIEVCYLRASLALRDAFDAALRIIARALDMARPGL